jgi:hypothetical protein
VWSHACVAAIVAVTEKFSVLPRVTFAAPSSSPPVIETVPAPSAPPLLNAITPPDCTTLPMIFAVLNDTEPASTVSARTMISSPAVSRTEA